MDYVQLSAHHESAICVTNVDVIVGLVRDEEQMNPMLAICVPNCVLYKSARAIGTAFLCHCKGTHLEYCVHKSGVEEVSRAS
jgi:hypothetical protein